MSKSSSLNRGFEQENTEKSYFFPSTEPTITQAQSFSVAFQQGLGWYRDNRDFLAEFVITEPLHSQYLNVRYSAYLDHCIRMDETSADGGTDDVMAGQIHHFRRS